MFRSEGERESDTERMPLTIFVSLILGELVLVLLACTKCSVTTFAILASVSGAAIALGAMAGFLFGIPKGGVSEPAEGPETEKEREKSSYRRNANLVEVSDWLTKILVGLGLVELGSIKTGLEGVGEKVSSALVLEGLNPAISKIVVPLEIIYFSILGFFASYLWTTIVYYRRMRRLDEDRIAKKVLSTVQPGLNQKFDANLGEGKVLASLYLLLTANKDLPKDKKDWNALKDYLAKTRAIFERDPGDRRAAILLARYLHEIEHDDKSLGLEAAINQLDRFVAKRKETAALDEDYADVLYNRAAYRAMLFGLQRKEPAASEKAAANRMSALADLRESIRMKPANAAEAQQDDDFSSLHDDPEFRSIVSARQSA
jgi:hypothetical protein